MQLKSAIRVIDCWGFFLINMYILCPHDNQSPELAWVLRTCDLRTAKNWEIAYPDVYYFF